MLKTEEQAVYRTAIYCRLSKEDKGKTQSNSIIGQIDFCKEYIENHEDLQLAYEPFCDDGYSGGTLERPAFQKMDKLVQEGKIDCIICRDLSRMTRDYLGGGRYLQQVLPKLGIRFIAINNSCDTLKSDYQSQNIMLPMLNVINDNYLRDTSMKIRSSLTTKRKKGQYVGAFCPYGYKRSEEIHHLLVPDKTAAEVVKLVFSKFKKGLPLTKIADQLNEMEVPTPKKYKNSQGIQLYTAFEIRENPQWEQKMVRRILTNDVYIGILTQGKVSTKNFKVKEKQPVPEHEWITVENAHEPIIDTEDFMAVQEMLRRNTRLENGNDELSLLSGFLICGDCNGMMAKKSYKTGGKKYEYYICSENRKNKSCSPHSTNAKKLEELVLNAIRDQVEILLKMEESLAELEEMVLNDSMVFRYENQIVALKEEIEKYSNRKLKLYEDFSDKIITQEEYFDYKVDFSKKIETKEKAVIHLEKLCSQAEENGTGFENWSKFFKDGKGIEEIDREVLMSVLDKVLIYQDNSIEVIFKYRQEEYFLHSKEILTKNGQEVKCYG